MKNVCNGGASIGSHSKQRLAVAAHCQNLAVEGCCESGGCSLDVNGVAPSFDSN